MPIVGNQRRHAQGGLFSVGVTTNAETGNGLSCDIGFCITLNVADLSQRSCQQLLYKLAPNPNIATQSGFVRSRFSIGSSIENLQQARQDNITFCNTPDGRNNISLIYRIFD